ncbi:TRAP transporter small permease subunit [Pseudomonadota bacterium]|nr:TRAP transporter small permease subunit [Pseudomonadota bacterium]MDC6451811.1 TRAP transporter small permease subunit [Alphaproteobacteria bacterium]
MALTERNMEGLVNISEFLRMIVNRVGRAGTWLLVPLVLITMWDVVARKLVWIQIYMVANFGSFFESTLMQEMEWHLHTAVFCLVLGYGYTHNRHVRVDFLREDFTFKSKAKVEFYGNIFFMLPFTLVCIYFAIIYMIDSYQINEVSASLVGLSQRWIIKTYLPIGFATLFVAGLAVMIQLIAVIWGDNKKKLDLIALEYDENK